MMILAKLAVGAVTTLTLATVYTFREGTLRVDVDEQRGDGAHVHFWAPAAIVPMALHFVPDSKFQHICEHSEKFALLAHITAQELRRYPNTTFVEVTDGDQHVKVSTVGTKIAVDVESPDENVHVVVPLRMIDDVITQLQERQPPA